MLLPRRKLEPCVRELIALAFVPSDREFARTLLASIEHDRESERIRIAAIRASKGSLDLLAQAADLARLDYRDLLMGAGFGHDTKAHLTWKPDWSIPSE